jgi:large subunit ribosomal protein L3
MRGLIGRKIGMSQIFTESGKVVPVTLLEVGPCVVTQVKTKQKDGYDAIQLGFGAVKEKHTTKPLAGHFKKVGVELKKILAEFVTIQGFDYELGQQFTVSIFKPGDFVDVTGQSKGKGFAGVIKRHNFKRQPETHGQKNTLRHPGSIGQASDPARVFKGMRMGGHMGNEKVTVKNLEVFSVDSDKNQMMVKGAIPGASNGIVYIVK